MFCFCFFVFHLSFPLNSARKTLQIGMPAGVVEWVNDGQPPNSLPHRNIARSLLTVAVAILKRTTVPSHTVIYLST